MVAKKRIDIIGLNLREFVGKIAMLQKRTGYIVKEKYCYDVVCKVEI